MLLYKCPIRNSQTDWTPTQNINQGHNVKRFREMLGIKQEAMAYELGDDWNQKKVSLLEQKDVIDDDILQQISDILKIPVEAIENFDEENAVNVIANTFDNGSILYGYQRNENCTFHPVDKIVQLHEEKIAFYERMLKEKDEMMAELKKLIK